LIDAQVLSEEEIEVVSRHYADISRKAARKGSLRDACSIEEARGNPQPTRKRGRRLEDGKQLAL
jgi:hypothetical protein